MPVRQFKRHRPHAKMAGDLKSRLLTEWRHPSRRRGAQPLILLDEHAPGGLTHVYVVWDEWEPLEQVERSEIILEGYEEIYGADKALDVTVAMGLTKVEAQRMGVSSR